MKRIILVCLILTACETARYVTNSNFYSLKQGMTEREFLEWLKPNANAVGGSPAATQYFNYAGQQWKVYVFNIYNVTSTGAYLDHQENVAFVDGKLREYGLGNLPLTIRQNPNSYNLNITKQ